MKIVLAICLFLSLSSLVVNNNEFTFENEEVKCIYHKTDGRFNGHYTSYYKNGKKMAEGDFDNNLRKGIWTIWDTTGKVLVQRDYTTPLSFISKYQKADSSLKYDLKHNSKGYIDYFPITEKNVVWAKRIWRTIDSKNNPALFKNDALFKVLQKIPLNDSVKIYKDDEFKEAISSKDIKLKNTKIVAYKIKEDCFTDNQRFVFETRTIGICPVGINEITKDTSDLYWIYWPYIRVHLAKEKTKEVTLSSRVNTLDDLFFFRNFSSTIYKESFVFDKAKTYNSSNDEKEIELIEFEHGMWMYFCK
ncbi:MAG: hypothetical protein ACO3EE_02890 [Flavobacteriales bacterium]